MVFPNGVTSQYSEKLEQVVFELLPQIFSMYFVKATKMMSLRQNGRESGIIFLDGMWRFLLEGIPVIPGNCDHQYLY